MAKVHSILYSPFSPNSAFTLRERSLLLQFFLSSLKRSAKEELLEHISLLPFAFPEIPCDMVKKNLKKLIATEIISTSLRKSLCASISPFLYACREEEGLILFLLRHRQGFKKHFNVSILLRSWYADGWEDFITAMKARWHERGFTSLSQEVAQLVKSI